VATDPERIGIRGSSYSGGHVLVVGANDRRVKCKVAQVPLINGHANARRLIRADYIAGLQKMFDGDRRARMSSMVSVCGLAVGDAARSTPTYQPFPAKPSQNLPDGSGRFRASLTPDAISRAATIMRTIYLEQHFQGVRLNTSP
jgi:hypothetical protein